MFTLNMGLFEIFYIYSFTINSGPRPSIFGFNSTFEVLGVAFCYTFPFNVCHFNNFMLL